MLLLSLGMCIISKVAGADANNSGALAGVAYGKDSTATVAREYYPDSAVLTAVRQYYPDYTILQLADLSKDLQTYFKETYRNAQPGCVLADFDGDGFSDYALMLLVKTEKAMGRIAVLRGGEKGVFVPMLDGAVRNSYYHGNCYIKYFAQGKAIEWDKSRTVILKLPGFEWVNWESSACVYFWRDGNFESLWTED